MRRGVRGRGAPWVGARDVITGSTRRWGCSFAVAIGGSTAGAGRWSCDRLAPIRALPRQLAIAIVAGASCPGRASLSNSDDTAPVAGSAARLWALTRCSTGRATPGGWGWIGMQARVRRASPLVLSDVGQRRMVRRIIGWSRPEFPLCRPEGADGASALRLASASRSAVSVTPPAMWAVERALLGGARIRMGRARPSCATADQLSKPCSENGPHSSRPVQSARGLAEGTTRAESRARARGR